MREVEASSESIARFASRMLDTPALRQLPALPEGGAGAAVSARKRSPAHGDLRLARSGREPRMAGACRPHCARRQGRIRSGSRRGPRLTGGLGARLLLLPHPRGRAPGASHGPPGAAGAAPARRCTSRCAGRACRVRRRGACRPHRQVYPTSVGEKEIRVRRDHPGAAPHPPARRGRGSHAFSARRAPGGISFHHPG